MFFYLMSETQEDREGDRLCHLGHNTYGVRMSKFCSLSLKLPPDPGKGEGVGRGWESLQVEIVGNRKLTSPILPRSKDHIIRYTSLCSL